MDKIRIVTYNIHKCRGMDGRISPQRIADVLHDIKADVYALQEVLNIAGAEPEKDQVTFLAGALGLPHHGFGETRKLRGGAYGNAILSRVPLLNVQSYDITLHKRERRGCLRADVRLQGRLLHIFNVHLGTAFMERRHQGRRLLSADILTQPELRGTRVVVGDFNEWTRGLTTKLMEATFGASARSQPRTRSYPGVLPMLHLDHVYFDKALKLEEYSLHRSRKALVASDHLPQVAVFSVVKGAGGKNDDKAAAD